MTPDIVYTEAPDPAERDVILKGLLAASEAKGGPSHLTPLCLLLKDPETGDVVGGMTARTTWRWLFIELLYVPESLRGTGVGRDLMMRAEKIAQERGCIGAWVDTYSFQARGFYEKLGYTVFGQIGDYPPGHSRLFLNKRFTTTP